MTKEQSGCTGETYVVNPDAPEEGTDIRHDGPCPVHDTRNDSCADRIASHLEGRADDVRKMLAAQAGGETTATCKHCGESIEGFRSDDDWIDSEGEAHCSRAPWDDGEEGYHSPAEDPDGYTEDSLGEFGLSLERKVTFEFIMSTGGPADWLEITCDPPNGDFRRYGIERVTYHFADWFDHAERVVTDGPLFELAEWIVEGQS